MRRVITILLGLLACLSLLLCIGSACMWVRSYWVWDAWDMLTDDVASRLPDAASGGPLHFSVLFSDRGHVRVEHTFGHFWISARYMTGSPGRAKRFFTPGFLGLVLERDPKWSDLAASRWILQFPYWFPTLLFLLPPILWSCWLLRRHRKRRLANQLCTTCGYDLRFSQGSCPECGAAIPPAKPATAPPATP